MHIAEEKRLTGTFVALGICGRESAIFVSPVEQALENCGPIGPVVERIARDGFVEPERAQTVGQGLHFHEHL